MIQTIILDDDVEIINYLNYFNINHLNNQLRIYAFHTPKEALEYLKNNHIDLLISDYQLGQYNGLKELYKFKSLKPEIMYSLMSTCNISNDDFWFLKKPFEDNDIKKLISIFKNNKES